MWGAMENASSRPTANCSDPALIPPGLLEKYNQPGPRYTSYPTAPEWDDHFGPADFKMAVEDSARERTASPLSLYLHLPFCQSLCLFCGCNVVINKNKDVAIPYLALLKNEIDWISESAGASRKVEQLHWGGGTPTYLSAEQIEELFNYVGDRFCISEGAELGIEIDPRATTEDQCRMLRRLGFNRISMGVQDFNPDVQKAVRRIQPFALTKGLFDLCRQLGFDSINIDLIYGLPYQTWESFVDTVEKLLQINPDRIALFSYAHVPWLKKQQGSFASHLPTDREKLRIFNQATRMLVNAGYRYIGMDHFARPEDELCLAQDERTLHRNFQGYTTRSGCDLYGMGVSSISAVDGVYAQNWRDLPGYYHAIQNNQWPTMRGLRLSAEDKLRRSVINRIMCHSVLIKAEVEEAYGIDFDHHFAAEIASLRELERDNLLTLDEDRIEIGPLGRIFIRNIAMAFDSYLRAPRSHEGQRFSKTL